MEKYREHDKPAAMSVAEHRDVAMDAWQRIVADFDAEIGDGKGIFTQRSSTQQSIEDEYIAYVTSTPSSGSVFDTLAFWKVSIYSTSSC
jgi:hypothetical protein